MLFFTLFSPTLILLLFLVGWFLGAAGEVRGHWASTVREEAEDGRGAAEAPPAAGDVGGEGCGRVGQGSLGRDGAVGGG